MKYQISWKLFQWEQSCFEPTEGQTSMTKFIAAFRNLENAPKYKIVNTWNIYTIYQNQCKGVITNIKITSIGFFFIVAPFILIYVEFTHQHMHIY